MFEGAMALKKCGLFLNFWFLVFSIIIPSNESQAAGRVFFDDFSSGKLNAAWEKDSYRDLPVVVSKARDGGLPLNGAAYMVEANSNGVVAYNAPNSYQTMVLPKFDYKNEVLLRFYLRLDSDVDNLPNFKLIRWGYDYGGSIADGGEIVAWLDGNSYYLIPREFQVQYFPYGYVGSPRNRQWTKFEIYIKQNINGAPDGIFKIWMNNQLVYNKINVRTNFGGQIWPLHIMSNWSVNGYNGLPDPDANNHVYWSHFEVFSDVGFGAIGLMSDASIQQIGAPQNVPRAPSNLRVR